MGYRDKLREQIISVKGKISLDITIDDLVKSRKRSKKRRLHKMRVAQ